MEKWAPRVSAAFFQIDSECRGCCAHTLRSGLFAACPCWHQSLSRSNNLFEIRADRVNELTKQRNLPAELEQRARAHLYFWRKKSRVKVSDLLPL